MRVIEAFGFVHSRFDTAGEEGSVISKRLRSRGDVISVGLCRCVLIGVPYLG